MSRQKLIMLVLAAAVMAGLGFFTLKPGSQPAVQDTAAPAVTEEQTTADVAAMPADAATESEPAMEPAVEEQAAEPATSEPAVTEAAASAPVSIDVAAALAERSLGDAAAPVTIHEYASLSCSHCAAFSKNVFGQIEESYINTGKVRFVFTDFPLNAPALDAAMVARCLPGDKYFRFLKFLFENQEEWAFSEKYKDSLRQYAKLMGASDEMFDSCLASEELKNGILETMKKAQEANGIQSTPSFIFNGGEVVRGEATFEAFSKRIDTLLAEGQKAE